MLVVVAYLVRQGVRELLVVHVQVDVGHLEPELLRHRVHGADDVHDGTNDVSLWVTSPKWMEAYRQS